MNVNSIRQKVASAIKKAPIEIVVYRPNKVDDGCGGYFIPQDEPSTVVAQIQGILDNSSQGNITQHSNPGGVTVITQAPKFITIWQEGIIFKKGDFFILDGIKYEIFNAVNILNLNIYWQLSLRAYLDEEESE